MSVALPDPTACAASTRLRPRGPVLGPAQRCPDCGHGYVNHGSFAYCDLCRLQLQLSSITEILARLLNVEEPASWDLTPLPPLPRKPNDET